MEPKKIPLTRISSKKGCSKNTVAMTAYRASKLRPVDALRYE